MSRCLDYCVQLVSFSCHDLTLCLLRRFANCLHDICRFSSAEYLLRSSAVRLSDLRQIEEVVDQVDNRNSNVRHCLICEIIIAVKESEGMICKQKDDAKIVK